MSFQTRMTGIWIFKKVAKRLKSIMNAVHMTSCTKILSYKSFCEKNMLKFKLLFKYKFPFG